ncbi:MAG: purine nucleoside permease [Pseudomonadota bacterium]
MPALKPKVLIVTTYEYGELGKTGSTGEALSWYTNDTLTEFTPVPGMFAGSFDGVTADGFYEGVFHNAAGDQCLIVSGMGQNNASCSLMALGFSDQIDLSETYVLVAGIAGGNPNQLSLGSVAWANWVVAGDLANLVAMAELPPDQFFYPLFHLGCETPWPTGKDNAGFATGTEVFPLNQSLAAHAYDLSKDAALVQQSDAVRAYCAKYDQPAARGTPSVIRGDSMASNFFFHGNTLANYAEWWMRKWTESWIAEHPGTAETRGYFAVTTMEDIAFATAARRLAQAGRLDADRLMILRGASNFDRPSPGESTMQSLKASDDIEIAFTESLENLYRAGSVVVKDILGNWDRWKDGAPKEG